MRIVIEDHPQVTILWKVTTDRGDPISGGTADTWEEGFANANHIRRNLEAQERTAP